jgi:alpha-glutamyl/putrescinyl thymine pyrophosphorylase clade 1
MNNEMLKLFMFYVQERYRIFIARHTEYPKPWTSDKILQNYRFCNVFREDDTVTRWIKKHIIDKTHKPDSLVAKLAIARWINLPSTLNDLVYAHHFEKDVVSRDYRRMCNTIDWRMNVGYVTWTSAYMIRAESDKTKVWYDWPKSRYILEVVVDAVWSKMDKLLETDTLQKATEILASLYGWGPFMAYEVVCDMAYSEKLLFNAKDKKTWANAGPGAIRGLNVLYDRPLTAKPKNDQLNIEMRELLPLMQEVFNNCAVVMRDVEHNLCEFDKYVRVMTGRGKPRQKYDGALT